MQANDFFHRNAETPLRERYTVLGRTCEVTTNSEAFVEGLRDSFAFQQNAEEDGFALRLWANGGAARNCFPNPYVRGHGALVYVGFDDKSSMLVDLRSRHALARVSESLARDRAYCRTVMFPVLMSVLAGSMGMLELHASCIERDGNGLILIGPSRSGKSTLALALAHLGCNVLSDDRTFCSINSGKLKAHGLPRPLKLRSEASHWFDELRMREPNGLQSGEPVFFCEPARGGQRTTCCVPQNLILLDRQDGDIFEPAAVSSNEVRSVIGNDLLAESDAVEDQQEFVMRRLLSLPCWRLRYGGTPQAIASKIADLFLRQAQLG